MIEKYQWEVTGCTTRGI